MPKAYTIEKTTFTFHPKKIHKREFEAVRSRGWRFQKKQRPRVDEHGNVTLVMRRWVVKLV